MPKSAAEISKYIVATFSGVDVVEAMESYFFFYNPDPTVPPDHRFPFATVVTSDIHDPYSNLNRPDTYRLNIGISKQTFGALFGSPKLPCGADGSPETGDKDVEIDFSVIDQVMPHPVYGRQHWACVLNPTDETLETQVRPLLIEAYDTAVMKKNRKATP